MNYKLAKQLKDAGFPQVFKDGVLENDWVNDKVESVYYPTLSQLIEACGDSIILHAPGTSDVNEEWFVPSEDNWTAFKQGVNEKKYPDSFGTLQIEGKTPEEAVAKLYIELNK